MLQVISLWTWTGLLQLPATGRDVVPSGYYLNNTDFLTGFQGESLSGKESKK
jgi:hypothetical protein